MRLAGKERQRITIRALRRSEPASAEIGIAEQRTETGVAWRVANGTLGERYGGGIVTLLDRCLGAGGNANVGSVDLVTEDRGAAGGPRTRRDASRKRPDQADGGKSGS